MARRIIVSFRVDEREREWLRAVAQDNGVPMSTMIKEAVVELVNDYAETRVTFGTSPCGKTRYRCCE